jgi:Spy/CpxP family protein refolding chaperone
MRQTLIVLIVIAVLTALAGAASAQSAPSGKPAGVESPPGPPDQTPGLRVQILRPAPCILPTLKLVNLQIVQTLSARLNLTEDQKTKITDLLTKADKDLKPKIENQVKLTRDYIAVLTNPGATQSELAAAAEKVMKAESELLMARIGALFGLKGLLTADQNKQLADYLEQSTRAYRETMRVPVPPEPASAPPK